MGRIEENNEYNERLAEEVKGWVSERDEAVSHSNKVMELLEESVKESKSLRIDKENYSKEI